MSAEDATVQQHTTNARQVGRGREHPGVARDAAEQPGARVVHLTVQDAAADELRRRHAAHQAGLGMKARVLEIERPEEDPLEVPIETRAADATDDLAEEDEAGVAVLERRARGILEGNLRDLGHRRRKSRGDGGVRGIRDQSGGVGHEPPDRDLVELLAAELLQVLAEGRVELDRALLDERHHRDRRADRFGEGGDVEDRVDGHGGGLRQEPARPVRALEQNVVAAADQNHDAGDLAAGDGVGGALVDSGEVVRSRNDGRSNHGWRCENCSGKREERDQRDERDTSDDHAYDLSIARVRS